MRISLLRQSRFCVRQSRLTQTIFPPISIWHSHSACSRKTARLSRTCRTLELYGALSSTDKSRNPVSSAGKLPADGQCSKKPRNQSPIPRRRQPARTSTSPRYLKQAISHMRSERYRAAIELIRKWRVRIRGWQCTLLRREKLAAAEHFRSAADRDPQISGWLASGTGGRLRKGQNASRRNRDLLGDFPANPAAKVRLGEQLLVENGDPQAGLRLSNWRPKQTHRSLTILHWQTHTS